MNTPIDEQQVKAASVILWFLAAGTFILGVLRFLGWYAFVYAVIYAVLAFFVQRRSIVALILAIAVLVFDALLGIFALLALDAAGGSLFGSGLRIILALIMAQALGPIRRLNQTPAPAEPVAPTLS